MNTGLPDEIVMVLENYGSNTQFVLGVVYETLGILVELSGSSDGRKICPDADNIELLDLTIVNPSSGLSIWGGKIPSSDLSYWKPVEKVFGITNSEFYNQIITNPSACFEVKTTVP